MRAKFNNIILIAGNGRNVGKTTLICQIIEAAKTHEIVTVKITPHFHNATLGLIEIEKGSGWIISKETNNSTQKDSSLYLKNGAKKSYYIQAKVEKLDEAFDAIKNQLEKEQLVIIESAALHKIIQPALFIFVLPDGKCIEKEFEPTIKKADLIVVSTGKQFYPTSKKIASIIIRNIDS
ncbi:MAG: hypothetical protein GQ525_00490 [Draconibacterium sp.]|nr:hypothetical protein [Draconibacterium sp.]